jgi:ribosomal protein L11
MSAGADSNKIPNGPWQSDAETPGPITERTESGDFEGAPPDGFQGPFFQRLGKRKLQGRDAKILVTAEDGQTGVGKSNLCDFLAHVSDTSEEGFTPRKITIETARFIELYGELPPKSALVMEEAEQFDSRRSQRNENVQGSQKWQQARVREIIAYLNLPDPSMIDRRFEKLADFWINVERRGKARIYQKKIHSTKKKVYYKTLQTLEWPNMDRSSTFKAMDELKDGLLEGETDSDGLIRESEAQKRIDSAVRDAREDCRDEWIKALKERGWTGKEIASLPTIDVKGARVNQIARGE